MALDLDIIRLKRVSSEVVVKLRSLLKEEVAQMLTMSEYHGFRKCPLSKKFIGEIIRFHDFDIDNIQLEIVHVDRDLRHEIHLHKKANAVAVCLDTADGFPGPRLARMFFHDRWLEVHAGDVIEIPARTPHGFTVSTGGRLFFLSAQSPPIVGIDESDDYFVLT